MARSVGERYAVAAFAFIAAATWLGVSVVDGLLCLLVALAGSQGMAIYQRRNGTRTRGSARRDSRARRPQASDRPRRPGLYDADTEAFEWRTATDAAW